MSVDYVVNLSDFVRLTEADNKAEADYLNQKKKYETAKEKDEVAYNDYVSGKLTKDQYLALFKNFLQLEQQFRMAEVMYKLESARGTQQEGQPGAKKPEQTTPTTPATGAKPGGTAPTPGTA